MCWYMFGFIFFFKQKTAYEVRISYWSSDVCSSDLDSAVGVYETGDVLVLDQEVGTIEDVDLRDDVVRITMSIRDDVPLPADVTATIQAKIGRASCRERVCQYV